MVFIQPKGKGKAKTQPPTPEQELGVRVGKLYRERFPDEDPTDLVTALEMIIDPENIKSNHIALLNKKIDMFAEQGGEAKPIDHIDNYPLAEQLRDEKDAAKNPAEPTKENPDMWPQDRATMVCGTCMNYLPKGRDVFSVPIGACKKNAPGITGYPRVYENEPGCGQHKMKVLPE